MQPNYRFILGANSISGPLTGIGHYSNQLILALKTCLSSQTMQVFANNRLWSPESLPSPSHSILHSNNKFKSLLQNSKLAYTTRDVVRYKAFQRLSQHLDKTLYHELQTIMQPFHGPSVTTVHDLSCLKYPDYHPRGRVKWFEKNLLRSLTEATKIICVSNYVRRELIQDLGVNPNKISTVYHGVDPIFKPRHQDDCLSCLKKHGLNYQAYILVVATQEPRKNLQKLLEAYLMLSKNLRLQFPLVLIGGLGWKQSNLQLRLRDLNQKGEVHCLGYVSNEDLPFLYSAAKLFIYPSLYEGFGLPVLEAIASGVPVITSKNTSMQEVIGDDPLLVNANDVHDIYLKLKTYLNDNLPSQQIIANNLSRANSFSWQQCALNTLKIYNSAIQQHLHRHPAG